MNREPLELISRIRGTWANLVLEKGQEANAEGVERDLQKLESLLGVGYPFPQMTPSPDGGLARVVPSIEYRGKWRLLIWRALIEGAFDSEEDAEKAGKNIVDAIISADAFAQKAVDEKLEDVAGFLDGQGQPGYADQIRSMKAKAVPS